VLTVELLSSTTSDFPFRVHISTSKLEILNGMYLFIYTSFKHYVCKGTLRMTEAMFKPGDTTASANISVTDDEILEYTEFINVTLSISEQFMEYGIMLGEKSAAVVEIYDNDGEVVLHKYT